MRDGNIGQGAVFAFTKIDGTWTFDEVIDFVTGDNVGFGSRLDLDGDIAIIDGFRVTNSSGNWGTFCVIIAL